MKKLLTLLFVTAFFSANAFAQCEDFRADFALVDSMNNDTLICTPSTIIVNDKSTFKIDEHTSPDDEIVSYEWFFGDDGKSSLEKPVHTYYNPGSYHIKLIVKTKKGCVDSIEKRNFITIIGPKAKFVLLNDSVCVGDSVYLRDESEYIEGKSIWTANGITEESSIQRKNYVTILMNKAGESEIKLMVTAKVKDPLTGVLKNCIDIYPFDDEMESPKKIMVFERPKGEYKIENGKAILDGYTGTGFFWREISNGDTTIYTDQEVQLNDLSSLELVVTNDVCEEVYWVTRTSVNYLTNEIIDFKITDKVLSINLENSSDFVLKIYNIQGQLVLQKGINSLASFDLKHLNSGVFIMVLESETTMYSQKITLF